MLFVQTSWEEIFWIIDEFLACLSIQGSTMQYVSMLVDIEITQL